MEAVADAVMDAAAAAELGGDDAGGGEEGGEEGGEDEEEDPNEFVHVDEKYYYLVRNYIKLYLKYVVLKISCTSSMLYIK